MKKQYQGLLLAATLLCASCQEKELETPTPADLEFTLAAIPDTQNMLDYKHQKSAGFAIDAADLFIEQMQFIHDNSIAKGGKIAFVTHLGDVWQHQTKVIDAEHAARGFSVIPNPWFATEIEVSPDGVANVEIPNARKGFDILDKAGIPYSVVPGNHDFDAMWSDSKWVPVTKPEDILAFTPEYVGMLHIGGLENYKSVFNDKSKYFNGKSWYIDSNDGGTSSAQLFTAGGYTFLHIGLDMSPSNEVLVWAQSVIDKNKGLPTILTTHDYLNTNGKREANPIIDLDKADPNYHNSAEELWNGFISKNEQIFMLLCGHEHGQNIKIDNNDKGNKVYQILSDYQDRGQVGVEAGQPVSPYTKAPVGIGDGWMRLMNFNMGGTTPTIRVKTYSTHYKKYSTEMSNYAKNYKDIEQKGANLSDEAFCAMDDYIIELTDFKKRFGEPKK